MSEHGARHLIDAMHALLGRNEQEAPPPSYVRAIDEREGVLILRLKGRVGKSIGAQTSREASLGNAAQDRSVIVDFAGTVEIDFTTLALLVQTLRRRAAAKALIAIINAPPKLRAEVQLAKLESLLPIYASEEEALRALRSRQEARDGTNGREGRHSCA